MSQYYVYILTNKKKGALYIGVTNDLAKRVYQHKNNLIDGFTKKYDIKRLIYYEIANDIRSAIRREKQIKKWYRDWKIELIERNNPYWKDLHDDLLG
jgi:putative endonuclease